MNPDMPGSPSPANLRANDANALWRTGDRLRNKARELREEADELDKRANNVEELARKIADGEL